MKTAALILAGASALALTAGLAACVPPHARPAHFARLKPISRLDCPDSQGELVRTSASPDGKSCAYAAGDDVVVQLKLLPVSGDAQAVLSPIETDLRKMATFEPTPPQSAAPAQSSAPPAAAPGQDHSDNVNIDLPGVHIHATDNGGANVQVGGVHVDADDKTNSAHIVAKRGGFMGHGAGAVTIDANDSGAIIHTRTLGPDVNQDLILASERPGPDGWRAVGYEALGPTSGPLVVAIVQSKQNEHDRLFGDVKALVRKAASG
jgi:hypothetical protein